MKKLILLSVFAFAISSCGYEVQFLFECNGVKVYRFCDNGRDVYFTDANGMTKYQYTTRSVTHRVQSINTKK